MEHIAFSAVSLFQVLGVSLLGLCLGSFATALIYRIPKNIPWVMNTPSKGDVAARSKCTHCGKSLGVFDLVPVFSWLFLRGRCRHCTHPVSCFYPLTELLVAALVMLMFFAWGWGVISIPVLLSVPFLVAAAKIDWDSMILPDSINLSLLVLALAYVALSFADGHAGVQDIMCYLAGAALLPLTFALLSFVMTRIKGRPVLGWGDIKFLVPAGLFLGASCLPSFLIVSGFLGVLTAVVKGLKSRDSAFPFGPSLIITLYIHLFLTGIGFYGRGVGY